jgi:hypothetical protein
MILSKGYWVAESNTNCPVHQIITTTSECKVAVTKLGFNYAGPAYTALDQLIAGSGGRPSGCYKHKDPTSKLGYYNFIVNPESTSPTNDTSGICGPGMITSR